MLHIVEQIEKLIIRALIILLLLALVFGTVELGRIMFVEITEPPFLQLNISKIFENFGLALIILIGLELLKILKMFLIEERIKAGSVVEITVIAVCNKIITLDTKHTSGDIMLGIAAILVALSASYFVFRWRATNKETHREMPAVTSNGEG
jgi:uncharacterized membrane protein (DUF373 family)